MAKAQVPSFADVVGRAVDKLVEVRPTAKPHVESGRYGDVVEAWRGQFELARGRLVSEVAAGRLSTASGDALSDVSASEYDHYRRTDGIGSVGNISFTRSSVHYTKFTATTVGSITGEWPDASDVDTLVALHNYCAASLQEHGLSVYTPPSSYGSHVSSDSISVTLISTGTALSAMVAAVNALRASYRTHSQNDTVHLSVDADNVLPTTGDAFFEKIGGVGADTFSNATENCKASLYGAVNNLRPKIDGHYASDSKSGVVRRGLRVRKNVLSWKVPKEASLELVTTSDAYIGVGQLTFSVPVKSIDVGRVSNVPTWDDDASNEVSLFVIDTLFDSNETAPKFSVVQSIAMSGGDDVEDDRHVVIAAKASFNGRFGPTERSILSGTLSEFGAYRAVVNLDYTVPRADVFACDASWASSQQWRDMLAQSLAREDGWAAWGTELSAKPVVNKKIRITANVKLRDQEAMFETSAISDSILAKLQEYFNNRKDWYSWKEVGIKASILSADRRIRTVSSVFVKGSSDESLAEHVQTFPASSVTHFYLADDGLSCVFSV